MMMYREYVSRFDINLRSVRLQLRQQKMLSLRDLYQLSQHFISISDFTTLLLFLQRIPNPLPESRISFTIDSG